MSRSVPNPRPARKCRDLPRLRVASVVGTRHRAKLIAGTAVVPCVLGPGGITRRKREGDGATPAGTYALRRVLFRPDRGPRPRSRLPGHRIGCNDGWCDDVGCAAYNRPVGLPFAASHERLWRNDRLYDVLVVIDYNLRPAIKGRGSAIFLHIQAVAGTSTAGCVAVAPAALRRLLGRIGPRTRLLIA